MRARPWMVSLGLRHRHSEVALRERFQPTDASIARLYDAVRVSSVQELTLVATCNRIELYAAGPAVLPSSVEDLVREWLEPEEADLFIGSARPLANEDALGHLMRVACGLDSQVVGDIHILGQLKRSFQGAKSAGAVGPILHRSFSQAFRAGKRVRAETRLMDGHTSFGARAAFVARRWARDLAGLRCLVVGCGKTGGAAARSLVQLGATDVWVTNRNAARAEALAAELVQITAVPIADLDRLAANADVVVTATAARTPIVTAEAVRRGDSEVGRARLFVDVSMPRNIDPEIASILGATLIDLDSPSFRDAQQQLDKSDEVQAAERVVWDEMETLLKWIAAAPVREALRPVQHALAEICRREVGFAVSDEQADRLANRIVSKFMARPMVALCEAGPASPTQVAKATALAELFATR